MYLVKEITRWFPTFYAIVLYEHHCFPMQESKSSSQLYIWTKGRILQNFWVCDLLWAKLTDKKLFKMLFIMIFFWKKRNTKEPGKAMAIRAFWNWTPNIWHKTTNKMNFYWKKNISNKLVTSRECDYTFSSSSYELTVKFIYARKVKMCKHYLGIGQQLLQKAAVLMTEGKCSALHNLKCCFSLVKVKSSRHEC